MKKFFLTLLAAMSAFCLYAYDPSIKDISIQVTLAENGTAHIVEVWDVVVASGTEWYLVRNNLGDIDILNLAVKDEAGNEFTNIGVWDVDRTLEQKTLKCGLHSTGDGYEICWGVGSYGPHVFTVSYDMTNAVKSLNDYDMLHLQLISDRLSSPPDHVSLELKAPVPLGEDNSRIWAFGYEGKIDWQPDGSVKAESSEPFISESSMIVLMRFDKGIFESSSVRDKDFSSVLDKALDGSFYPDESEDSLIFTILGIIIFLGTAFVFVLIPILSLLRALGLINNTDRRRIKGIFGVRRLPKKPEWERALPFGGDIYETYYIASHLKGVDDNKFTVLSSMILKMIMNGTIVRHADAKGKNEFYFSGEKAEGMCTAENKLLAVLKEASGRDGVLQEKEFKKWAGSHVSKIRELITSIKVQVLENFRTDEMTEGMGGYSVLELNEKGRSAALQALGFRQFLKDFTLVNERYPSEVHLWKDYLVMASLFGIAGKVAEEMKAMAPNLRDYSMLPVKDLSDLVVFTDTLGRIARNSYVSYSSPSSRGSSGGGRSSGGFGGFSSFGGGGGFSGGGSGGGSR